MWRPSIGLKLQSMLPPASHKDTSILTSFSVLGIVALSNCSKSFVQRCPSLVKKLHQYYKNHHWKLIADPLDKWLCLCAHQKTGYKLIIYRVSTWVNVDWFSETWLMLIATNYSISVYPLTTEKKHNASLYSFTLLVWRSSYWQTSTGSLNADTCTMKKKKLFENKTAHRTGT